MTERGYADMVRRDVRMFVVSGLLLVASLACLVLWALDMLGRTTAAPRRSRSAFSRSSSRSSAGSAAIRRIRDRLFVLGPALGAALPIGIGVGGPVGLGISFALALLATLGLGDVAPPRLTGRLGSGGA